MIKDKHPGSGKKPNTYNYEYYIKKFNISQQEVAIALREIRMGSPEDLEKFLKLKYQR